MKIYQVLFSHDSFSWLLLFTSLILGCQLTRTGAAEEQSPSEDERKELQKVVEVAPTRTDAEIERARHTRVCEAVVSEESDLFRRFGMALPIGGGGMAWVGKGSDEEIEKMRGLIAKFGVQGFVLETCPQQTFILYISGVSDAGRVKKMIQEHGARIEFQSYFGFGMAESRDWLHKQLNDGSKRRAIIETYPRTYLCYRLFSMAEGPDPSDEELAKCNQLSFGKFACMWEHNIADKEQECAASIRAALRK